MHDWSLLYDKYRSDVRETSNMSMTQRSPFSPRYRPMKRRTLILIALFKLYQLESSKRMPRQDCKISVHSNIVSTASQCVLMNMVNWQVVMNMFLLLKYCAGYVKLNTTWVIIQNKYSSYRRIYVATITSCSVPHELVVVVDGERQVAISYQANLKRVLL